MSGYPDLNYPAFDAAKAFLTDLGFAVISPADLTREDPESQRLLQITPLPTPLLRRHCMQIDLNLLLSCDALYLLKGWEHSGGASIETSLAYYCSIPCFDESTLTLENVLPDNHEPSTVEYQIHHQLKQHLASISKR